jgi:ATP-dependent RNA helicase DHX33
LEKNKFHVFFGVLFLLGKKGRQFPIEIYHSEAEQTDYLFSSIATVFQIHRTAPIHDDILLFLTGQEEIDSTVKSIMDLNKTLNLKQDLPMICLPFYATLPSNKQLKVFEEAPITHRKVIVSTNIAETSITIKRIKYVIDSGMIKSKQFISHTNMEVLKIQKISKSQAWQRSGRAGREQPGICYRLYTGKILAIVCLHLISSYRDLSGLLATRLLLFKNTENLFLLILSNYFQIQWQNKGHIFFWGWEFKCQSSNST